MVDAEIKGANAWDGVQDPVVSREDNNEVVTSLCRLSHSEDGLFSLAEAFKMTTNEYVRRIQVMGLVKEFLEAERRGGRQC